MDTDIVTALIALGGSLGGILLTAFFVSRQAARDLRTNIAKEVEIVKQLRPGAPEAELLDEHIAKSIRELIRRDELREQASAGIWLGGTVFALSVTLLALTEWRQHGFWPPIRIIMESIYWGLWIAYASVCVEAGHRVYLAVKAYLRLGKSLAGLGFSRVKLWKVRRDHAKLRAYIREFSPALREVLETNEERLVAAIGREEWDDMVDELTNLEGYGNETDEAHMQRMAKQIEKRRSESSEGQSSP